MLLYYHGRASESHPEPENVFFVDMRIDQIASYIHAYIARFTDLAIHTDTRNKKKVLIGVSESRPFQKDAVLQERTL